MRQKEYRIDNINDYASFFQLGIALARLSCMYTCISSPSLKDISILGTVCVAIYTKSNLLFHLSLACTGTDVQLPQYS